MSFHHADHANDHHRRQVPILQQDSKVLYESVVLFEYLDEIYGAEKLIPADPYCKAKDKLFIDVVTNWVEAMKKDKAVLETQHEKHITDYWSRATNEIPGVVVR
ncbi:hypothetical protein HPB47_002361 [Ixodes persulcatus]|uniref:Uncharacterized protein n=1 Tax=Ixodes persulcatus TaxID=34615 RepID=A0AC60PMC1_IXOPE|nr:hypothetical protein HPB47_002361 [Ixodes persulcatus]